MDDLAEQFLDHPKRRWFVGGAVAAVLLAAALPAVEGLAATRAEAAELRAAVAQSELESGNLAELRARFAELKAAAKAADGAGPESAGRGLTDDAAESLRVSLTAAVRDAGCHVRAVQLGDPTVLPWADGPPPVPGTPAAAAAAGLSKPAREAAAYDLVTRRLTVDCVGTLPAVVALLGRAADADPHARPADLSVAFESEPGAADSPIRVAFGLLLLEVRPREADAK